jgi:hypothetical protein
VLNVLFVFYLAMKETGRNWPLITESVQDRCLTRLNGQIRFIEGLTSERRQHQAVVSAMADNSEPWMLAIAFGELKEHGLLGIKTDAEKHLVPADLNLVECVAAVAKDT